MSSTQETLAKLEVVDKLHRLPDSALLRTELAALFLSSSTTTLERMRADGSGPAYYKAARKALGERIRSAFTKRRTCSPGTMIGR